MRAAPVDCLMPFPSLPAPQAGEASRNRRSLKRRTSVLVPEVHSDTPNAAAMTAAVSTQQQQQQGDEAAADAGAAQPRLSAKKQKKAKAKQQQGEQADGVEGSQLGVPNGQQEAAEGKGAGAGEGALSKAERKALKRQRKAQAEVDAQGEAEASGAQGPGDGQGQEEGPAGPGPSSAKAAKRAARQEAGAGGERRAKRHREAETATQQGEEAEHGGEELRQDDRDAQPAGGRDSRGVEAEPEGEQVLTGVDALRLLSGSRASLGPGRGSGGLLEWEDAEPDAEAAAAKARQSAAWQEAMAARRQRERQADDWDEEYDRGRVKKVRGEGLCSGWYSVPLNGKGRLYNTKFQGS